MNIKISDIAENKLSSEEAETLQKYFQEGGTWKELLEFSDNEAEGIYSIAYDYYEKKQWEQAIGAFSTLIQLNPYEPKYWMGLGASMQMKEDFEEALAAYQLVLIFEENHIPACFASAQCFYRQGNEEKCKEYLEKVKLISAHSETDSAFSLQAAQVLATLETKGHIQ